MIDRDHTINLAIQTALEGGHSEVRTTRNDREYQFDISQITADGLTAGTVLLAFDVTEQAAAERSRREFTANVSHELNPPCTPSWAAPSCWRTDSSNRRMFRSLSA